MPGMNRHFAFITVVTSLRDQRCILNLKTIPTFVER